MEHGQDGALLCRVRRKRMHLVIGSRSEGRRQIARGPHIRRSRGENAALVVRSAGGRQISMLNATMFGATM